MTISRSLLLTIAAISCVMAIPASAFAATTPHTLKCYTLLLPTTNHVCSGNGSSIGTVTSESSYSGRDLAVGVVWRYDSESSVRVWNIAKIRTKCKSSTVGSSAVFYKSATRKVYSNLRTGGNTSYWRGALALKTTCPSGFKARSFTINGGVFSYTSSGGVGFMLAKFT